MEVPDCYYLNPPLLVRPCNPTPCHSLYLSNLDDQPFLRFSIKYLYVYRRSVPGAALAASLAKALVEYYPLAGRLVRSPAGEKLEIECNAQGAVLAEAYAEFTADEYLRASARPHQSWRKLLYRQPAESFLDVPPLVVQVTHLSCGGMVLCTAFNHCLCDAVGTAQFLHAWALLTAKPSGGAVLPVAAFHGRGLLKPREPPRIDFPHSEFTRPVQEHDDLAQFLLSQPLSPVSITFTAAQILRLKKQCVPLLKCTSFEALAWHVWRAWVRALDPPPALRVKLLFSVNVRRRLSPELPAGYYGNAFVLACAETSAAELAASGARFGVRLVQAAKDAVDDDHVRSVVDLLEQRRAQPDLSASLVISPWTKLGLEEVDFGGGRPAHMGPVASEIYCLFLPVVGDLNAFTMLVSVPQAVADKFRHYCTIKDSSEKETS